MDTSDEIKSAGTLGFVGAVKVLCTELGGEYVTNTRNPKYYGSCKVDNTAGGKG